MLPIALTIAGSDPSGGAGIQADLKTFHQFGVYGTSAITLLTVQNTRGVRAVQPLPANMVREQIDAVLEDLSPQAAKTGALGTAEVVEIVAEAAQLIPLLVVDPVMSSTAGKVLLERDGVAALIRKLLPHAFLVSPNLEEASLLARRELSSLAAVQDAVRIIADLGPQAVLIKGGHLEGDEATDVLYYQGQTQMLLARRVRTPHTHGTGCTYSAAITALLAKGTELTAAVRAAKLFITRAIQTSPGLGRGNGPVNHFAETG